MAPATCEYEGNIRDYLRNPLFTKGATLGKTRGVFSGRGGGADPTSGNIEGFLDSFGESSTTFGLFIGYLVSGSIAREFDAYSSPEVAYFCIQGRGMAAMAATASLVLSAQMKYALFQIKAVPLRVETEEEIKKLNAILYRWLSGFRVLEEILHWVSLICLGVFMVTFSMGLYSVYETLDWTAYMIVMAIVGAFLIYELVTLKSSSRDLIDQLQNVFNGGSAARPGVISGSFI